MNQRADLVGTGNTVTNFAGTGDAAWASALTGVDALVIAEQEKGALSTNLSDNTKTAIASFVINGGNLAVAECSKHRVLALLNSAFGTSFAGSDTSGTSTITAAGLLTEFGSGPGTVPGLNAVYEVNSATLGSATAVYDVNMRTSVFTFKFGAGNVTFMGYD